MKVDFKFKWLKCHLLMVDINIPMSLSGESESGESWISSNISINTQLQWRGKPRMFQPVKGWNKWHKLNLLSDKIDCSIEAWAESNNWLLRERSEKCGEVPGEMTLEYIAASLLDNLYDHISQHWLSVYFMYYISLFSKNW